jgi:hypothetical protein
VVSEAEAMLAEATATEARAALRGGGGEGGGGDVGARWCRRAQAMYYVVSIARACSTTAMLGSSSRAAVAAGSRTGQVRAAERCTRARTAAPRTASMASKRPRRSTAVCHQVRDTDF